MPIRNCPILSYGGNKTGVSLPIHIINPATNQIIKTCGLIDTGASECAIPANFGVILGLNIPSGKTNTISTGNGLAVAFKHAVIINIYHPLKPGIQLIHTINNVEIDFMLDLPVVLLGVTEFLAKYTLYINYPKRIFSLTK